MYTHSWKRYFPIAGSLFNVYHKGPWHTSKMVNVWFEEHSKGFFKFPRSQSKSSIQNSDLQYGGNTSNYQELKDLLLTDTTAHLQRSSGDHASTGQGYFSGKRGPTQFWEGNQKVVADRCLVDYQGASELEGYFLKVRKMLKKLRWDNVEWTVQI